MPLRRLPDDAMCWWRVYPTGVEGSIVKRTLFGGGGRLARVSRRLAINGLGKRRKVVNS